MTLIIWFTIFHQAAADPDRFNNFLLLGYAVMWLVCAAYVISLANRQRNVRQDLELLERILNEEGEADERDVDGAL